MDELRPDLDERPHWDVEHDWPHERLRTIETELAELEPDGRHIDGASRDRSLRGPTCGRNRPWLGRVADVNPSPLPDLGHGFDLGM
jgi:hypothetical protein